MPKKPACWALKVAFLVSFERCFEQRELSLKFELNFGSSLKLKHCVVAQEMCLLSPKHV